MERKNVTFEPERIERVMAKKGDGNVIFKGHDGVCQSLCRLTMGRIGNNDSSLIDSIRIK